MKNYCSLTPWHVFGAFGPWFNKGCFVKVSAMICIIKSLNYVRM